MKFLKTPGLIPCVWLDLDGTIADNNRRMAHYHAKEWLEFYDKTYTDTVVDSVRVVVRAMHVADYSIMVCTARPEHNRPETADWLDTNEIPWTRLYMRPDRDHRHDLYTKYDMLVRLRDDGFWPIIAFDDRNRIVQMLRAQGITVLQPQDGDY